jgi:pimeloyl-ACP methyl ester carboxylesterase
LRKLGIECCESLPTLAFAVPPDSANILAATYSYRLMRNFATRGYRSDLAAATKPLTLIAGAADELMLSDKYAEALHDVLPSADVKLLDGIDHMGVVSTPSAVNAIAEDIATRGAAGT